MKNKIQISFLALLILIFTSCGKLIDEFYLTPEMKANIPFQGNETISFEDKSGNIIEFSGGDRISNVDKTYACYDCRDYSLSETENILFNNNNYSILLSNHAGSYNSFKIVYSIGEKGFAGNFNNSPLSKETLENDEMFFDSIEVNNQIINNVFGCPLGHIGTVEIDPYPTYCYYSTAYGIVKIDFSDSTSWELENIEW